MSLTGTSLTETVPAAATSAPMAAPAYDSLTLRSTTPQVTPPTAPEKSPEQLLRDAYENTAYNIRHAAKIVALGGATVLGAQLPDHPIAGAIAGFVYAATIATAAFFVRNRHNEGEPVEAESKEALGRITVDSAIYDEFDVHSPASIFGTKTCMVASAVGKAMVCNNVTQLITYPMMGLAWLADKATSHRMPVAQATVMDAFSRIGLITPLHETPDMIQRCSLLIRRAPSVDPALN